MVRPAGCGQTRVARSARLGMLPRAQASHAGTTGLLSAQKPLLIMVTDDHQGVANSDCHRGGHLTGTPHDPTPLALDAPTQRRILRGGLHADAPTPREGLSGGWGAASTHQREA